MAAIQSIVDIRCRLGAELLALRRDQGTLTATKKHDVKRLADSSGTTYLWDSLSDTPATFDLMAIVVDPDDELSSTDPVIQVALGVTGLGVRIVYCLKKSSPPLLIGPSTVRSSIGGSDLAIVDVSVRAVSDSANVRCLILD